MCFVVQSISRASLLGLDVLLSFSSALRRWRFESFSGYGFAWFRHETCWGSAFSHALPKDLFLGFCRSVGDVLDVLLSFSIVRFVGDVSRVFLATVLHGLGTKPAGVLLFRMRSPKTFFLGFAWLPAGFPSFCFFLVGSKGNVLAIFLAAVSQWLGTKPAGVLPFVVQSISRASLLGFECGDVSRVLLATVLHGLDTKPAGVRVFRMRFCLVACYLSSH